jgi:hypothetical protein
MKKTLIALMLLIASNAPAQNCDSVIAHYQAIRHRDSLTIKDRNFRLNWIQHYASIVRHNPSQLKFLMSWISRQDCVPPDTIFRSNPVVVKKNSAPIKKKANPKR